MVGDELWSAGEIIDRRKMIDTKPLVEGGVNLLEPHRTILHLTRNPIGRADHLPGPQAAAGQERAGCR